MNFRRQDTFHALDLETGETQFVIDSDPDDGEEEWESGKESFVSAPAIDATGGEVAWAVERGFGYRGSSTVVSGTVYFATSGRGSDTPRLYAADAASGSVQWSYEIGPSDGNQECRAATAFAHGAVLIGHTGGQLHAVEPDGTERWTVDTDGAVYAAASGDAEHVYVGTFSGSAYAIDPESGEVRWIVENIGGEVDTPPIPYEDTVYVNTERGPLVALRA